MSVVAQAPGAEIARARLMAELKRQGINSPEVLAAMESIPREHFLPRSLWADAYANITLPIGENQTISQPFVVALMTEKLDIDRTHKVLEIGTGSGYQCAILCKLARRVFTIERIDSLAKLGVQRLNDLRLTNFINKVGDGTLGWPEQEPFDRIILTAAGPQVPESLLKQLRVGGVLVAPIGTPGQQVQRLMKFTKKADGSVEEQYLCDVQFVPLLGAEGFRVKSA